LKVILEVTPLCVTPSPLEDIRAPINALGIFDPERRRVFEFSEFLVLAGMRPPTPKIRVIKICDRQR
jgi:hypothetical protein